MEKMNIDRIKNAKKARLFLATQMNYYLSEDLSYTDIWESEFGEILSMANKHIALLTNDFMGNIHRDVFINFANSGKSLMDYLNIDCKKKEDLQDWHLEYFKIGEKESKIFKEDTKTYCFFKLDSLNEKNTKELVFQIEGEIITRATEENNNDWLKNIKSRLYSNVLLFQENIDLSKLEITTKQVLQKYRDDRFFYDLRKSKVRMQNLSGFEWEYHKSILWNDLRRYLKIDMLLPTLRICYSRDFRRCHDFKRTRYEI